MNSQRESSTLPLDEKAQPNLGLKIFFLNNLIYLGDSCDYLKLLFLFKKRIENLTLNSYQMFVDCLIYLNRLWIRLEIKLKLIKFIKIPLEIRPIH